MSKAGGLVALAVAGGLAGCASSDGVPISPGRFEGNTTVQTLTGVGLIPRSKEEIAYRPRSPLVLPQRYDLREPEAAQIAQAGDPAWPQDPDIERRRKQKEFEALPLEQYRRQRGTPIRENDVLMTAEEFEQGRRADAGRVTKPIIDRRDHDGVVLLPSEYERQPTAEELEEKKLAATTPEPRRRYLTEPPTGYRAPVEPTSPEGKKAAEEALEERQKTASRRRGLLGLLGL